MTDRPRVSVVCSTHGRAHELPGLLDALAAQTMPVDEFEVIVVDDGSPDDTGAVLERLAPTLPYELRIISLRPNQGASAGRNAGWQAARAELIAFTDDDCRPTPGWLLAGVEALEAAGPHHLVAGPTDPVPEDRHLLLGPFSRSLTVATMRYFETCNIFYRRDDLESVGGMSVEYGFGGEDTEMALRLLDRGVQPVWVEAAHVHHGVRPSSFRANLREARRWGNLPKLLALHPDHRSYLLDSPVFWKRTHPPTIAALVGIAAALAWWSPRPLALGLWWVVHRLVVEPACPGPRRRVLALPGTFVIDATEVATVVEGSIRHGAVLL